VSDHLALIFVYKLRQDTSSLNCAPYVEAKPRTHLIVY